MHLSIEQFENIFLPLVRTLRTVRRSFTATAVMLACVAPEMDEVDFVESYTICGADNGPESEYEIPIPGESVDAMPIEGLSRAQMRRLSAKYNASSIVDLSALGDGTTISRRTLMDLGARFPGALAIVLPQSALDALNTTTPCADDDDENDASTVWLGAAEKDGAPARKKKPSSRRTSLYGQIEEAAWDKVVATVTFAVEEEPEEEPEESSDGPLTAKALAAFAVAHPKTLVYVPLLLGSTAATVVALDGYARSLVGQSGVLDLGRPTRIAAAAAQRIHADGKHAFEVEMTCHIRSDPMTTASNDHTHSSRRTSRRAHRRARRRARRFGRLRSPRRVVCECWCLCVCVCVCVFVCVYVRVNVASRFCAVRQELAVPNHRSQATARASTGRDCALLPGAARALPPAAAPRRLWIR